MRNAFRTVRQRADAVDDVVEHPFFSGKGTRCAALTVRGRRRRVALHATTSKGARLERHRGRLTWLVLERKPKRR